MDVTPFVVDCVFTNVIPFLTTSNPVIVLLGSAVPIVNSVELNNNIVSLLILPSIII